MEYPRIEQAVYVARKRAWFKAVGSAYIRYSLQGTDDMYCIMCIFLNNSRAGHTRQPLRHSETVSRPKNAFRIAAKYSLETLFLPRDGNIVRILARHKSLLTLTHSPNVLSGKVKNCRKPSSETQQWWHVWHGIVCFVYHIIIFGIPANSSQ